MRSLPLILAPFLLLSPVQAKYSGGSGTAQDPYQLATAADLIGLGETPEDYDKDFVLTADIDLDPNLPGGKVFDRPVIAPSPNSFTGVFDGSGYTISHLTIMGGWGVALFGKLGSGAQVKDVGVADVHIAASGSDVGGLVGHGYHGTVTQCYSTGAVSGTGNRVGGLVGSQGDTFPSRQGTVWHSVWDMETSGLLSSAGGVGLTTAEMMDPCMLGLNGFANDPNWTLDVGRDYPRLAWEATPGQIFPGSEIDWLTGQGTLEVPYRVDTADQLILLGKASTLWGRHFALGADIWWILEGQDCPRLWWGLPAQK